jgi:LacI family transcriptional regulator
MKRKTTIADVARHAGISQAAVSRWLNGKLSLPPATASKIRQAVKVLDYQPNAQARRLSQGRSDTIGIIVPDISNPFFSLIASEAERTIADYGYDLVIWSSRNQPEKELTCFERLSTGLVDGLLLITNHADDGRLAAAINKHPRRTVIIDEDVPGALAPRFFVENEKGGYAATRLLLELGHRYILHIGGPRDVMSATERASGWRLALHEAGIAPKDDWRIFTEYEVAPAFEAAHGIFARKDRPSAVFAGSDAIALGVMMQARAHGVAVPSDLSLVGFDGMPIVDLLGPPLTSVAQPIDELGRRGALALFDLLNGANANFETHRLPVSLVSRSSAAAPGPALLAARTTSKSGAGNSPGVHNRGSVT